MGINFQLRINEPFCNKIDQDYHKGSSPLEMFDNLNIVDSVVLEYMHNICLGVMKRLLSLWKKVKKPVRFVRDDIANEISLDLINLKYFFP